MIIIDAKHRAPDVRLRPIHGDRFGEWVFNEKNFTIAYQGLHGWYVDLEKCSTSARMLNSIFQATKHRYDPKGLVEALTALLDPQRNLCSDGIGKPFNPTKWLERPRQPKDVSKAEFDAAWKKFEEAQRLETAHELSQKNFDRMIAMVIAPEEGL